MILTFDKLFKSIDESDTNTFLSFLSDMAIFKFGNMEPVHEKTNIGHFLNAFFESIDHTRHFDIKEYSVENMWFSTGMVEYTRKNGSTLTVPFCNKFEMDGDNKIQSMRFLLIIRNCIKFKFNM